MRVVRGGSWFSTATAVSTLLLAIPTVATGTIPDSDGVFHGCHAVASGDLRLVEPGTACASDEAPVTWSVTPARPLQLQGIAPGSPLAAMEWSDVTAAAVAIDAAASCTASYTGYLVHRGGTTQATVRILVRPASGGAFPLAGTTMVRESGDPLAEGAIAAVPFAAQGLVVVPEGGATIVPQVWAQDETWVLGDPSVLLVSC